MLSLAAFEIDIWIALSWLTAAASYTVYAILHDIAEAKKDK